MPQFLDILHSEHEEVKGIFSKLQSARSSAKKEELFTQLKRDLVPHMKGEEKYFYPELQKSKDYQEDVLEAIEEHHAARLFLNELDDMNPDGERWDAKVSVLKEMIEHHIEEEESTIFPEARQSLSEEQMKGIAEQFESMKSRV